MPRHLATTARTVFEPSSAGSDAFVTPWKGAMR